MPIARLSGCDLHYELDGDTRLPVLVLSNALGTHLGMWAPQIADLQQRFRVLRYDTRGHGRSSVPTGEYRLDQLGGDVIGLLDLLGIARAHFCGLSMGGLTGMWLATHQPQRIDKLVLSNTAARVGSHDVWQERIATVLAQGMGTLIPNIIDRWFTKTYQAAQPDAVAAIVDMLQRAPIAGYAANCAALRDADLRGDLGRIQAPTLVITGKHDGSIAASEGRMLAAGIAGAHHVELDAAHLSNWERSAQFTEAVVASLCRKA